MKLSDIRTNTIINEYDDDEAKRIYKKVIAVAELELEADDLLGMAVLKGTHKLLLCKAVRQSEGYLCIIKGSDPDYVEIVKQILIATELMPDAIAIMFRFKTINLSLPYSVILETLRNVLESQYYLLDKNAEDSLAVARGILNSIYTKADDRLFWDKYNTVDNNNQQPTIDN